ncbi:MAG TPA: VCBS repeat-containing protein, partial [Phycisphaeraceae bacterium]
MADGAAAEAEPAWTGRGAYRLLVSVPPIELAQGRERDELVAACPVDWAALLRQRGVAGSVDLSTLQVHRYDPGTGVAEVYAASLGSSEYDRPVRFDDESVPEAYVSRVGRASQTDDGRAAKVTRQRKARLFNRLVRPDRGRIVWAHTQIGNAPSHYAIYFDVSEPGAAMTPSPAPWIGDVDVLRRPQGQPLGGFAHFTAAVGDLNGDGLFDLVAGTEKGDVMWFPNQGRPGQPRFTGCLILTDEEGPIDTGWYAAPFLFDWDDDGLLDLIVGTSGNVILWWRNVGSSTEPRMQYRGFVQADGQRLEVPQSPVAEDTSDIFAADYYNQPWIGDWDGDGEIDLLTGGYTTGRIFHYRAQGRDEDGVPRLTYVGELQADGQPIDTTWAAAPCAADFDGDGDQDLITGSWWWSGIPHPPEPGQVEYLMYYRNDGTARQPRLVRAPLMRVGEFPRGAIARPSAVDVNQDGLIDLVVSDSSGQIYIFLNIGTQGAPRWQVHSQGLTIPWGFVPGVNLTGSWADFEGDGKLETLAGQWIR